jgi:flagellar hook-associated protein 3 FlgL
VRVSHLNRFDLYISRMNSNLSDYMELNHQAAAQKKILRPSDDPVGTARVMQHRSNISALDQYQENVDTAKGWLNLADETLMGAMDVLTKCKEMAEQGATGTLSADNREQISFALRQYMDQLVNMSNVKFENKSIFAGHKVTDDAYEKGLMVVSNKNDGINDYVAEVQGNSEKTILVQFTGAAADPATVNTHDIEYRWTEDGGKSWNTDTMAAGASSLNLGGVTVDLHPEYQVNLTDSADTNDNDGTWLYIMPTAVYQGDDENQSTITYASDQAYEAVTEGGFERDVMVEVVSGDLSVPTTLDYRYSYDNGTSWIPGAAGSFTTKGTDPTTIDLPDGRINLSGSGDFAAMAAADRRFTVHADSQPVTQMGADINARAEGTFNKEVVVRIENDVTFGATGTINYVYSTDGGANWSSTRSVNETAAGADLVLPGGIMKLTPKAPANSIAQGDQFIIHPRTAGMELEISQSQSIQVNSIGKDIFGGHYKVGDSHSTRPVYGDDPSKNLFESMGRLVGYLETNNQEGIGNALEDLRVSSENVLNKLAEIGARENRLDNSQRLLETLEFNEVQKLSRQEDADVTELMTRLASKQVTYQTILQSSSMIMNMNLTKFL